MKTFLKVLAEKTSIRPSSQFESTFWNKFESEFGIAKRKKTKWFEQIEWQFAFGTLAAASLVFALVQFSPSDSINLPTYELADLSVEQQIEMMSTAEFLEEYEHLSDLDELPMQDDEWKILIGENS